MSVPHATATTMTTSDAATTFHASGAAGGTCLQGYVVTTFDDLVAVFGPPHGENGDKITVEWCFVTDEGTVFTIYDWKLLSTPLKSYSWHIGGKSIEAVDVVQSILRQHGVTAAETLPHPIWSSY